jgi:glutamyl-tRNA synthetase
MAETPAARARLEVQGRQGVVRLKMPQEGRCVFEQRLRTPPEAASILRRAQASLQTLEPFNAVTLQQWLQDFIQAEGLRHGQIIHALRVAVAGKAMGFGLFESLAILGKPQCLARIERALARL